MHRIEINPGTGVAATGSLNLRVYAWDAANNYIWIEDRADLSVSWSAELEPDPINSPLSNAAPMAIFSNASVNPTILNIGSNLPRPLVVKAIVSSTISGPLQKTATYANTVPASTDRVQAMVMATSVVSLLRTCSVEGGVVTQEYGVVNRFFNATDLDRNLTETDTGTGIPVRCPRNMLFSGMSTGWCMPTT